VPLANWPYYSVPASVQVGGEPDCSWHEPFESGTRMYSWTRPDRNRPAQIVTAAHTRQPMRAGNDHRYVRKGPLLG